LTGELPGNLVTGEFPRRMSILTAVAANWRTPAFSRLEMATRVTDIAQPRELTC
jgi:hypothetical protein